MRTFISILLLLCLISIQAAESERLNNIQNEGEVRVPLPTYNQLIEDSRKEPISVPADYAIGQADVTVTVSEHEQHTSAHVTIEVQVEIFAEHWTLVPLLPLGVALTEASKENGQPVQLVQTADGLAWSSQGIGITTLHLAYTIDARRAESDPGSGYTLTLPIPQGSAAQLTLNHPATNLDFAIVPATRYERSEDNNKTTITADIPSTKSILISWHTGIKRSHVISRARYQGELSSEAVIWRARYQVEVFSGEQINLALLPASVNLIEISIDGQPATVIVEKQTFHTLLQGRGLHDIEVVFQVPIQRPEGPPQIDLRIPQIPMSQFELTLVGDKEVKVFPQANVTTEKRGDNTIATVFMPMTKRLSFSWLDAVPEDLQTQVRANASLYHALYAEEGVLHGQAMIAYEITRGETNLLELIVPSDVQINRIRGDGVADWTVTTEGNTEPNQDQKRIKIFLDRAVSGDYLLNVFYERLLGSPATEPLAAPVLQALTVNRQRGMIALLAGQELTLKPLTSDNISAVGENQLPAFIRNQLQLPVAHTYKYTDQPTLTIAAVAPERKQGKFNALVDTLISIGEVTLRGTTTVEINVKSGAIMDLQLRLPADTNILSVTGPALRSQQTQTNDQEHLIALEFNREMAGQFQIEVNYERIMADSVAQTDVPLITVTGAEVEHGRIAVEALTAVEVQAQQTEQLSLLDINDLPQQLVLKTTNPILLAYKYVHTEAPRLTLRMVRHQEIEVQLAAIENAHYQSLITRDGLVVTTAKFIVRNSRRQFLRLDLPPQSQIWSVFVDGKSEKPAHASDADDAILIKLINSATGFPVDIVYATPTQEMASYGILTGRLPRPDMVVTHTYWDIYLPVQYRYLRPAGNIDVVVAGRWANPRSETMAQQQDRAIVAQALRINVPTQGIHFRFEKLYANQAAEETEFSLNYIAEEISTASLVLSGLGALLIWLAILALWGSRFRLPRSVIALSLIAGIVLLLITLAYLRTSPILAASLTLVIVALWLIGWLFSLIRRWRQRRTDSATLASAES